jgi:hypothetical protein
MVPTTRVTATMTAASFSFECTGRVHMRVRLLGQEVWPALKVLDPLVVLNAQCQKGIKLKLAADFGKPVTI